MGDAEDCIDLPPGFRFHPTDEEIITHYLSPKVLDHNFSSAAIGDVDFNKCEPWDLPSKAKMGEKEWYFFCQRDRKYPTGTRTNRATEAGYWKATGKDKEIMRGKGVLVGMKKTLVFYKGRAPKGEKTNWVMHEFRLEGKSHHFNFPSTAKDEWAVCKVFHKTMGFIKTTPMPAIASMNSFDNNLLNSPTLPPLMDTPYFNHNIRHGSSYVDHSGEALNFKGFSSMPSNFSTMVGMENKKDDAKSFLYSNNLSDIHRQLQSSMFHPQTPSANYYQLAGPTNMGYLHPASTRALAMTNDGSFSMGHCKVEPLSSRSMLSFSQETAQSTDRNTEISSVASKHEMGYNDIDDLLSAGQGLNLENMWKC